MVQPYPFEFLHGRWTEEEYEASVQHVSGSTGLEFAVKELVEALSNVLHMFEERANVIGAGLHLNMMASSTRFL